MHNNICYLIWPKKRQKHKIKNNNNNNKEKRCRRKIIGKPNYDQLKQKKTFEKKHQTEKQEHEYYQMDKQW